MKRLSLILTVFLLGVMLVSCGTTLKKTSDKGSVAETIVQLEKTAKPEISKIIYYFDDLSSNLYIYTKEIGAVEPNADIEVNVLHENDGVQAIFHMKANSKGEFGAEKDEEHGGFNSFEEMPVQGGQNALITITAKVEGKQKSDPLEIKMYFDMDQPH